MAVNGTAYSKDVIMDAVTAAKTGGEPIDLLVKRGEQFDTLSIRYDGGLRYPWIEPSKSGTTAFDRLLEARTR